MPVNKITSPRLLLRSLTRDDVSTMYVGWLNDPEVNQYLETRFAVQTIETCLAFVDAMNADPNSHLFGMFDLHGGSHIGNIKLGFIKPQHKTGELSLFIGNKSYWGKGLATGAIGAMTRWAFDSLGLEKVEAGCYDDNAASLRAFLKSGYSVEGFLRKHVCMGDRRSGCFQLGLLKSEAR